MSLDDSPEVPAAPGRPAERLPHPDSHEWLEQPRDRRRAGGGTSGAAAPARQCLPASAHPTQTRARAADRPHRDHRGRRDRSRDCRCRVRRLQRLQEPAARARPRSPTWSRRSTPSVYDSTGGLIHVFHNEDYRHIHVDLDQISPYFKEAIVAIEDHNFYTEGSWDLARLVESGVADVTHRGAALQGGSTITEQLAKISLYGGADPPQSIDYKIKEIVLGNEIALNFTKSEILDMYVNRIFYGNFAIRGRERRRAVLPQAGERARPCPGCPACRLATVAIGIQPAPAQHESKRSTHWPKSVRRRCCRPCRPAATSRRPRASPRTTNRSASIRGRSPSLRPRTTWTLSTTSSPT